MTDDTLIEDLVRAGVAPDLVGRVANALTMVAFETMSRTMSRTNEETVRIYERRRKREQRGKSGKPEANDAGVPVTEVTTIPPKCPGHVPDNQKNAVNLLTSFLTSSEELPSKKDKKEMEDQKVREVVVAGRRRGKRITRDWRPSIETVDWCRREHGLVGARLDSFIEEFIDYWDGVPGQRGTKLNWDGTLRNRVREKIGKANGRHRQGSLTDLCTELADEARELERQAGIHRPSQPVRRD